MRTKPILLALVLMIVLALSLPLGIVGAQQPTSPILPDSITVTGVGTAFADPDVAYINAGVEVANEDVTLAVAEANERVESMIAVLAEQGITSSDIRTENFYIYRENYGPMGMLDTPIFRVNNSLRVTVRDIDRVPEVLSQMLSAGANSVNGVFFDIEDTSAIKSEARALSIEDARQVGEELAALLGVSLGDVISVTEASVPYYGPMYGGAGFGAGGGGGAPPIEAGSFAVTVNVQVTFTLVR